MQGAVASREADYLAALALSRADEALYAAKRAGRHRVHCHAGVPGSPAMQATRR